MEVENHLFVVEHGLPRGPSPRNHVSSSVASCDVRSGLQADTTRGVDGSLYSGYGGGVTVALQGAGFGFEASQTRVTVASASSGTGDPSGGSGRNERNSGWKEQIE